MKKLLILLIAAFVFGGLFAAPLTEGFESPACPAAGWTIRYANQSYPSGNTMTHSTTYSYAGARSFRFSSFSSGTPYDQYLITPELNVTSGDQTVSFWYRKYSSGSETFRVGWSSTGTEVADFFWSADITNASTTWQQYTKTDLPVGTKHVAIHYKSNYAYYLYIDEFVGPNINPAPEPSSHVTGLAATPSYTNVKLDWTGSTGTQLPMGYLIQAIKVGAGSYAAVADGTPVADDNDWSDGNAAVNVPHATGANTYTFAGLISNAAYEFKIWPYTNSGADIDFKVDAPIPTVSATTLDATIYAANLPYLQNFDSVTPPALPVGWLSLDNNGDGDKWVTSTSYPNSSPNSVCIYTDYNSSNDDYLVTPRVELTGNQRLKFWTRARSANEPEEISVLLSSTTPEAANFTLTAMASTAVNFTTYTEYIVNLSAYTGFHYIAFARKNAPADGWYLYVDDVLIENLPQVGVLAVNPDPVNCGSSYIGFQKTVQVSLTNIGGVAFDVTSISLADYTDFQLANLPSLPVTISPGAPAVTFDVVFAPTVAGSLTTNLLINDTRQASSIVVSGTGRQTLVGEICEYPYLATLPLVDYAGTTNGYNDDYTSAMFTGLNNPGYVSGKDWVAKISIPEDGWLDISLTDQAGYSSQWMGVFLVNTIPSLANPATVLAQATASSGLMSIDNAVVSAGDYYVIVDNYPSPADVYFVLNMSFQPFPTGPVAAPNLDYPADRQTDLPKDGFPFQFSWNMAGAEPERYDLWIAKVSDLTTIPYDPDDFFDHAVEFYDVTSPYQPAYTYDFSEVYVWTVLGARGTDPDQFQWPPYEFTIVPDPTITIPHTQDFGTDATPVWPYGWTQTYSGGISSNRWTASASNSAGGTANEMKCSWYDATGISRLITPPIITNGIANILVQFNHYFNDWGTGATAKVQYSHDLATWYDTNWSYDSGSGDDLGQRAAIITGINQPVTYVAWTMDGDHYQFDYWHVDDVIFDLLPDHDVATVSIGGILTEVVDAATPIYPTAQVTNLGANVETFTVTATWNTYTDTQTVSNLGVGQNATVNFTPFTPNTYAAAIFSVTTNLATDENTANDMLQIPLIALPLDRPALADNLWSDYLVGFNLKDPGTFTNLINKSDYQSFYAGDWMNGKWYGCEDYDTDTSVGGGFWQIDPPARTMTSLGSGTTSMHGLAWDDVNGILYGHDAFNLYTLNPATGAILTTVGPHGITYGDNYGGLIISIAYDNYNQILYAIELGNASLYTLDVTTGAATKVGGPEDWLGIDVNYAQDMAFDQDTGLIYLAGYTQAAGGVLYWVDTTYGYAWKIGDFQGNSEMDAFAIPYGDDFIGAPEVTIAADGTLSWPGVNGAAGYYVYAADDPYGTYTKVATVYALNWLDPNFPEAMKFYKVVAFGGRAASNDRVDVNINPALRKTGTRVSREVTTSPADRNQRQIKK